MQEAKPGLEQIDQLEDSIKQNTTYTSHLLITVPLPGGEPGSAHKLCKQWSYTLRPILYLYTLVPRHSLLTRTNTL